MKDNLLIGVGGLRNSGKDTVVNIMDYIIRNGITRANYKKWIINGMNNTIYKNKTVAFADGIKDILSRLFGISRDCFDNRIYKDELYYHLKTRQFITVETVEKENVSVVHSQMINTNFGLNQYVDTNACIKLRTLMQWFGTEIGRNQIYDEVWIDDTIRRANEIRNRYKYCFISDIRFGNEVEAIHKAEGIVILIERPNLIKDDHPSEKLEFEYDYSINNDGSLMTLFYRVLEFIKQKL